MHELIEPRRGDKRYWCAGDAIDKLAAAHRWEGLR